MIELKALAACWAMKKCNMYLQGLHHFTLLTDHQPLIPILNSMGIAHVENPRLMMKILPYSLTAQWIKGKDHLATDALSCFLVDQPSLDDELCEAHAEAAVHVHFVNKSIEDLQSNEPLAQSNGKAEAALPFDCSSGSVKSGPNVCNFHYK